MKHIDRPIILIFSIPLSVIEILGPFVFRMRIKQNKTVFKRIICNWLCVYRPGGNCKKWPSVWLVLCAIVAISARSFRTQFGQSDTDSAHQNTQDILFLCTHRHLVLSYVLTEATVAGKARLG